MGVPWADGVWCFPDLLSCFDVLMTYFLAALLMKEL
jgi:hypothetical protein